MQINPEIHHLVSTRYDQLTPIKRNLLKTIANIFIFNTLIIIPLGYLTLYNFLYHGYSFNLNFGLLVLLWSICEVAFNIYSQLRHRHLGKSRGIPFLEGNDRKLAVGIRMVVEAFGFNPKEKIEFGTIFESWLLNRPKSLTRPHFGHFKEMIIYLMYDKYPYELTEDEWNSSEEFLVKISKLFCLKVPVGFDSEQEVDLELVRPTVEPVKVYFKPFLFQLVIYTYI